MSNRTDSSAADGGGASMNGVPRGSLIATRYRVERAIGKGGMGAVFAAIDTVRQRQVAIKVMLGTHATDATSRARFQREVKLAGAIDCDHVVRLLDSGELEDGRPFMVLELLSGLSLKQLIAKRAPLATEPAVRLVLHAVEGVAEVHRREVVHRDLKPSNLFIHRNAEGRSVLKVLDFGISKLGVSTDTRGSTTGLTESHAMVGSPFYASPEQIKSSKRVDTRTDIWSLGVILHELLTGKRPFQSTNMAEHLVAVLSEQPIALRRHSPEVPEALEAIVLRCLARECVNRYSSVADLAEALLPFAVDEQERVRRIRVMIGERGARALAFDDDTKTEDAREGPAQAWAATSASPLPVPVPARAPSTQATQGRKRLVLAALGALGLGAVGTAYLQLTATAVGGEATPERLVEAGAGMGSAAAARAWESTRPAASVTRGADAATANPAPAQPTVQSTTSRPKPTATRNRRQRPASKSPCVPPYYFKDGIKVYKQQCLK